MAPQPLKVSPKENYHLTFILLYQILTDPSPKLLQETAMCEEHFKIFIITFYLCIYFFVYACTMAHMWKSEDNGEELVVFFHCVHFGD